MSRRPSRRKPAQKLLAAGRAPRPVVKRTLVDRLNIVAAIITGSLFIALVIAALEASLPDA